MEGGLPTTKRRSDRTSATHARENTPTAATRQHSATTPLGRILPSSLPRARASLTPSLLHACPRRRASLPRAIRSGAGSSLSSPRTERVGLCVRHPPPPLRLRLRLRRLLTATYCYLLHIHLDHMHDYLRLGAAKPVCLAVATDRQRPNGVAPICKVAQLPSHPPPSTTTHSLIRATCLPTRSAFIRVPEQTLLRCTLA